MANGISLKNCGYLWFIQKHNSDKPISESLLNEKAHDLSQKLGC